MATRSFPASGALTETPAEFTGLNDNATYILQNNSGAVVKIASIDSGDTPDNTYPHFFEIRPAGGTHTIHKVSGERVWLWVADRGRQAQLKYDEVRTS